MKVFPPYDKSKSDTNERATRWAHREDVATGAQKIISHHGKWYIIEKFDSAEQGYYIIGTADNKAVEKITNEVKRRGRAGNNQRVQRSSDRFASIDAKRNRPGGDGYSASHNATQYRGENVDIQQMGSDQNSERRIRSFAPGSNEYDGADWQNSTLNDKSAKYSVRRKSESAEDSSEAIWLPKNEYAMVSRAIMAKNAGVREGDIKPVDYVYAADEFYVYKNNSLGNFTVLKKLSSTQDVEEINYTRETIDNGTYAGRQRFDRWTASVRSRRGSDIWDSWRSENADTERANDRLSTG